MALPTTLPTLTSALPFSSRALLAALSLLVIVCPLTSLRGGLSANSLRVRPLPPQLSQYGPLVAAHSAKGPFIEPPGQHHNGPRAFETSLSPRTFRANQQGSSSCSFNEMPNSMRHFRRATSTGISLEVFSWYSAYGGYARTARCHHRARSSPWTSRTSTSNGSGPSWIVTSLGCATRL